MRVKRISDFLEFFNLAEYLLTNTVIHDIESLGSNFFFDLINIGNIAHFYWIFGVGIIFRVMGILIPANKFFHLNKKQR